MAKRKTKAYYKEQAARNARSAKTSQVKLKSFKEGFKEGLAVRRD